MQWVCSMRLASVQLVAQASLLLVCVFAMPVMESAPGSVRNTPIDPGMAATSLLSAAALASWGGVVIKKTKCPYFFAVTEISIRAPATSFATPTVARAGRGSGKNFVYTAFIFGNRSRSVI